MLEDKPYVNTECHSLFELMIFFGDLNNLRMQTSVWPLVLPEADGDDLTVANSSDWTSAETEEMNNMSSNRNTYCKQS